MVKEIILASKSKVRKKILETNKINCIVEPSNVDEESIKESLLKEKASPEIISKNLDQVEQFKNGNTKLLGFFVGQVMKATQGKANPKQVNQILNDRLS